MPEFVNDDAGYIDWIKRHPCGYIVVSWNPPRSNYTSLYRADCPYINPDKAPHVANWTEKYIKSCAVTITALQDWAEMTFGAGKRDLKPCGHCVRAGRIGASQVHVSSSDSVPKRIANELLCADDIPSSMAPWEEIQRFALTFDGYAVCGSFERCAEIANAQRRTSLTEARVCLFFEQRRWRHFGTSPDDGAMRYIRSLVENIRQFVMVGLVGEVMVSQDVAGVTKFSGKRTHLWQPQ